MSDQQNCKKSIEEEEFSYFLESYETATGQVFQSFERSERPDFICIHENGKEIGFEITKVLKNHQSAHCLGVSQHIGNNDPYSALDRIYVSVLLKDKKRRSKDWKCSKDTVLVLQLMDWRLSEIHKFITDVWLDDFNSMGFKEIWIADYTGIEALDLLELFCILPEEFRGYYKNPNSYQKPFG